MYTTYKSISFAEIEGEYGGKHTPVHMACVVGDTVGDPFKDTSGPVSIDMDVIFIELVFVVLSPICCPQSLNILIKLMSIISLIIAPLIAGNGDWPSDWWKGLIPIFLMIIGTYLVYFFFWKNAESITPIHTSSKKEMHSTQRKAVTEFM